MKTADLCREHGISEASYYDWKAKYGGLGRGLIQIHSITTATRASAAI